MADPAIQATLTIFSRKLSEAILEKIDNENKFTTVTDNNPSEIAPLALALLCLGNQESESAYPVITHIGIVKKNQRVATQQARLRVIDTLRVGSISVESLIANIPDKFKELAKKSFTIGYQKVPLKTGELLLKSLVELSPENKDAILELSARLNDKNLVFTSPRSQDAAAEKDALSIALDIFGLDRTPIIESWRSKGDSIGNSFLNGLTQYIAYEDDIISHDLHTLPGWNVLSQAISGVVEFENKDKERLLVINANRKPVEKALGVDLIYFHRKYEAFTLIQYKMMDQKTGDDDNDLYYYNPNQESHTKELDKMRKLHNFLLECPPSNTLSNYRISNSAIFFKVCKKLQLKAEDASIAAGAYIPISQWEILLKDPSTKGPNGGCQIGYHTLGKRYITTQTFIDLVQKGYIGTQSLGTEQIAAFVSEAIENGHSVMYAIDERKKGQRSK